MRVGLPSNHPDSCVALATQWPYCIHALTCWLAKRGALDVLRPAVPLEQLAERPVCGEGARKGTVQLPFVAEWPEVSPPSCWPASLVSVERHLFSSQNLHRGRRLSSLFLLFSGSFRLRF